MRLSIKFRLVINAIILLLIFLFLKTFFLKFFFHVSGEITISSNIENYFKYNNMLFIVARNSKNMPVAIKKIINPVLPLKFTLQKENLIFSNILTTRLKIYVFLNSHGEVGILKKGDLYNSIPCEVFIFSRKNKIEIDSKY